MIPSPRPPTCILDRRSSGWNGLDELESGVGRIPQRWELFERSKAAGEPERTGPRVALVHPSRAERLHLKKLHPVSGQTRFDLAKHEGADTVPVERRLDRHQVDLGGVG